MEVGRGHFLGYGLDGYAIYHGTGPIFPFPWKYRGESTSGSFPRGAFKIKTSRKLKTGEEQQAHPHNRDPEPMQKGDPPTVAVVVTISLTNHFQYANLTRESRYKSIFVHRVGQSHS